MKNFNVSEESERFAKVINLFSYDSTYDVDKKSNEKLKVREKDNRYLSIKSKDEFTILSNFIIKPVELVEMEDKAVFKLEFHTTDYEIITMNLNTIDFSSVTKFKAAINKESSALIYRGNAVNLEEIKYLVYRKKYRTVKSISCAGIMEHKGKNIFVSDKGCIDADGSLVDDVRLINDQKIVDSNIVEANDLNAEALRKISNALFKFNDLSTTATILGFCSSCFLKERLWQRQIKLNHLLISGEAGGGKSETAQHVIMALFDSDFVVDASKGTKFVNTKVPASNNTIPCIIEEFKPSRMTKSEVNQISTLLRNAYDRSGSYRGRPDQKLNVYKPLTPLILVGEMSIEEKANLERSLAVFFSKEKIKDKSRQESFKLLKNNKKILGSLGKSLLKEALKIEDSVLIERHITFESKVADMFPDRVVNSVANCMVGLTIIQDIYTSLGLDFEKETGFTLDEMFDAIINGTKENLLNGRINVKGIIETAIELFNEMAELKIIKPGHDFQVTNGGLVLALNIKAFYDKYIKYVKSRNLIDVDILSQTQFTRQLRAKSYFAGYGAVKFNDSSTIRVVKAYKIDIEKLKEDAEIDFD